jgi:hypothetical protein
MYIYTYIYIYIYMFMYIYIYTHTHTYIHTSTHTHMYIQVAFGVAGSHIISHNITEDDDITALVPGTRVRGIFGFCDVRNFTVCTECLQVRD